MRRFALVVVGSVVASFVAPAFAEPPPFSVETLAPDEGSSGRGFAVLAPAETSDQPSVASVTATAIAVGLGELDVYVEARRLKADGGTHVDVAWVDVDADPTAFRAALEDQARARGWAVRELSSPHRLLVVGGTGAVQETAIRHQLEHLALTFVDMAGTRLLARVRHDDDRREAEAAARRLLEHGRRLDVDAAALDTLDAFLHWRAWGDATSAVASNEAKLKKNADDAQAKQALDKAKATRDAEKETFIALAKKAFAKGRPVPAPGWLNMSVAGRSGGILLEEKNPARLKDAIELLEVAVAAETESPNASLSFENRYNLSCAYARADRIDDAFRLLEKALDSGATQPAGVFGPQWIHLRDKDEDMGVLRRDPRWDELIQKFQSEALTKWEAWWKKAQADAEARRAGGQSPHGGTPTEDEAPDEEELPESPDDAEGGKSCGAGG